MLIPTGVVESEVRRTPWASIGLLVLLAGLFLTGVHGGVSTSQMRDVRQELEHTVELWYEHPWLRAPEGLADMVGASLFGEVSEEIAEARSAAERSRTIPIPVVAAKQQEELDALFDRAARLLSQRGERGLSYVPARPEAKALVAHMFLHGGFWHLFGNVPFLFDTAPFLEDVYGRFLFVPLLFLPMFRFTFALPAFVVLPLWFGEQVLSAKPFPSAPIAWRARIGGFAFGMAVAIGLKLSRVEERWIDPAIEGRVGPGTCGRRRRGLRHARGARRPQPGRPRVRPGRPEDGRPLAARRTRRRGARPRRLGQGSPGLRDGFRESAKRAEEEILRGAPALASSGRSLPVRRFAAWREPRTLPAHAPA